MAPDEALMTKRALLSVFDKTGLIELATFLSQRGVELVSTGGTAAAIRNAGRGGNTAPPRGGHT